MLYHYTTQDGLIGIVKERALWATKIHYMNDASELTWPLDVARTILTTLRKELDVGKPTDKEFQELIIDLMLKDVADWKRINLCVASFCTNGDLLSQWRGYGVFGSAYSIGFDTKALLESIGTHPFELRGCRYHDTDTYRRRIDQLISEVIDVAVRNHGLPEDFLDKLVRMATTTKLKCFGEENEWRLVSSKPLSYTGERFDFRSARSMIVPYYSLPFEPRCIVQIIIGPCQHPELAKDAVYGLAHKFKLNKVQGGVIPSEIPYRVF